jgi:hypothetical protein
MSIEYLSDTVTKTEKPVIEPTAISMTSLFLYQTSQTPDCLN